MLQLFNISKSYIIQPVLSDVSFTVNYGERVSLVGPNGCGKTTLMRIIVGAEQADKGHVRFNPPELGIGYLAQALAFEAGETVAQALTRATPEYSQAQANMAHYALLMAQTSDKERLTNLTTRYAEAETHFEAAGGYALESRMETILAGLGLADIPRHMPVAHLSGGQKTRLSLAGLLVRQPALLLLDEPTNHLDIDALTWLEAWLRDYEGAALVASHDRAFLDATTTRTLVIDPVQHTLRDFAGNYSAYTQSLVRERERQRQAYSDQQQEIAHLKQTARHLRGQAKMKRGGKANSGDKFATGHFANRSTRSVGRAKQIEQRITRLQTEERLDKPGHNWQLKLDFANNNGGARQVLRLENISMAFAECQLFRDVNLTLTHGQRIALTGPNGTGKTTLLRIIAETVKPVAGQVHLGAGVKMGYAAQEQEILNPAQTPYETIQAAAENMNQTDIRNFLHYFLFAGDDVFVKISSLSFGERSRLMLALLVAQGCNFLLLDEPINHLDIPSRERFEQALSRFPGTILAVVHDRTFIRQVATAVWDLREGQIRHIVDLEKFLLR